MKKLLFGALAILFLSACSKLNSKRYEKLRLKHSYKETTFNDFLNYNFWDWPKPFRIIDLNYSVDSNYQKKLLKYLLRPSSRTVESDLFNMLKKLPDSIYIACCPPLYAVAKRIEKERLSIKEYEHSTKVYLSINGSFYTGSQVLSNAARFNFRYIPKIDTFEILMKDTLRDEMMWGKDSRAIFFNSIKSQITLKQWFFTDSLLNTIKHLKFKDHSPFLSEWSVEGKMDYPANKKQEDGLIYKYRYKIEKFPDSLIYPDTTVVYLAVGNRIKNKCPQNEERDLSLRFKEFSPDGIIDLNPETDKYEISIRSLWYIYIQDIIYGPLNSCYSPAYYENNLYQLKRKFKRYIRKSFRKDNLSYHKSFFKLALYKLYNPNKLILVSKKGKNAIFQFTSTNLNYPGNYEVKFDIYEPYNFKVFKR